MSQKDISKYFTKQDGTAIANDTEFAGLATHTVIKNTNSGLTFKKVGATVFDKTPIEVETDAVLYTAQTLTDAQKLQARTNIGATGSDAVLYTQQSLTNSQKTQARENIGAISLSDINSLISGNYTNPYANLILIGNLQIVFGYSYSGGGQPRAIDRSFIAEFSTKSGKPYFFSNIPLVLGTEQRTTVTKGTETPNGTVRPRNSPAYATFTYYDGGGLERVGYLAIGTPFTYDFVWDNGIPNHVDLRVNRSKSNVLIIEMFIDDLSASVEINQSTSTGIMYFNSDTSNTRPSDDVLLHEYGWRDGKVIISDSIFDYSVNKSDFKIRAVDATNAYWKKICYKLTAINDNVSLKFIKTGTANSYIKIYYNTL